MRQTITHRPPRGESVRSNPNNSYRLNRLRVLFAGSGMIMLMLAGLTCFFARPERALELWGLLGPLIGSTIGYLLGGRAGANR